MLIDLLNSSNYIMINREAIKLFGLNTAIYCSELLNIYKKAAEKAKFVAENAFKVDRDYIKKQTTLSVEEQLKCDCNLQKVNVINISKEDPDVLRFNVEVFASLLSSEDVKILDAVKTQVNTKSNKEITELKRSRAIISLKESIICQDYDLLIKLRDWVDAIMADPARFISKPQVEVFTATLFKYCKDDVKKAKAIVDLAIVHQYVDCNWAINLYEKNNMTSKKSQSPAVRVTEQKRTKKEDLWEGEGF